MKRIGGESLDIKNMNIQRLKKFFSNNKHEFEQLFPESVAEGKVNLEILGEILGEYVEDEDERYDFTWNGKKRAIRISQTSTTGTLRPDKENSRNWDETENIYIEGDNLEVLKLLQKPYHSKVKMIYIDPPYNTGKDFVYKDNYRDNMKNYLEYTGQVDNQGKKTSTNLESSGRYHTDWLNMMYPRLRLARNLLTEDGVIFISIDDNEVHNLRKVCDEIFGEGNFLGELIWERTFSPKNDAIHFSNSHDNILVYSKREQKNIITKLPRTEEANSRYKNFDNDSRGRWISDNMTVKTASSNYIYGIKTPSGKEVFPTQGRSWFTSKENMNKLILDNRVWFGEKGENVPRLKRFLSDVQGGMVQTSILKHQVVGHNQEGRQELKKIMDDKGYFDGPKPKRFLRRIIYLGTRNGSNDTVLDFFSGSGTTAHAVMELNKEDGGNRKFIMVQLPEETDSKSEAFKSDYKTISDIGRERIRRAGDKIKEDNKDKEGIENLDIGFKAFKLDSSNIKEWNPEYQDKDFDFESLVNNFIEDRNEEDILYEIILKYGIDLTTPIEEHDVDGKIIYDIGFGTLYICLDNNIGEDIIQKIVELNKESGMERARVVFRDTGFKDDETKLNAKLTLENNDIGEVLSI